MQNTKQTILVIGPSGAQQMAAVSILRSTGAEVHHVAGLAEYSRARSNGGYDLVVIDIPDDPGEALHQCELVRAMPEAEGAAVVLVTNYDYGSDTRWLREERLRPDVCLERSTLTSMFQAVAA